MDFWRKGVGYDGGLDQNHILTGILILAVTCEQCLLKLFCIRNVQHQFMVFY